jgi:hypothetical protein
MVSRSTLRFALLLLAFPVVSIAQAPSASPSPAGGKKPLTIADYSKWRSIDGADLSPDGKWVAYTLRYSNVLPADAKPALHIANLATNQDVEVPNAHDASFSSDSRWGRVPGRFRPGPWRPLVLVTRRRSPIPPQQPAAPGATTPQGAWTRWRTEHSAAHGAARARHRSYPVVAADVVR